MSRGLAPRWAASCGDVLAPLWAAGVAERGAAVKRSTAPQWAASCADDQTPRQPQGAGDMVPRKCSLPGRRVAPVVRAPVGGRGPAKADVPWSALSEDGCSLRPPSPPDEASGAAGPPPAAPEERGEAPRCPVAGAPPPGLAGSLREPAGREGEVVRRLSAQFSARGKSREGWAGGMAHLPSYMRAYMASHRLRPGLDPVGAGPREPGRSERDVFLCPALPPVRMGEGGTAADQWAVLMWGLSSFLVEGCPGRPRAPLRRKGSAPARAAWARAVSLAERFLAVVSPSSLDDEAIAGGRAGPATLQAVRALEREVGAFRSAEEGPWGGGAYLRLPRGAPPSAGPLPVVASRVALPERGGTFTQGARWLPPGPIRAAFLDPSTIRLRDAPRVKQARVHASREEWRKFLSALAGRDMVSFARGEDVARGNWGESIRAGFFAAPKDAGRDRTICNRKPGNSLERQLGLCGLLLPHAASLTDFQLAEGEWAEVNGDDLDNYYHRWRVSRARACSNAIGPALPRAEIAQLLESAGAAGEKLLRGLPPGGWLQPLLTVLPMGDLNAVDFATLAHLRLLRDAGCVQDREWLVYRFPVPAASSSLWEGVMVDDHNWIARRSPDPSRDGAARAEEIARASEAAYRAANLPRAERKSVRRQVRATLWGATVDGQEGWVAASDAIRLRAFALTMQVLDLPLTSVFLLMSVLGLWTHVLLFRRVGFALLDAVFRVARSENPRQYFVLPATARAELAALVGLCPGFVQDLRASVATRVTATDASSRWAAIVEGYVSTDVAQELWRWRVRRGGYVRLETEWEATVRELQSSEELGEALLGLLAEGEVAPPAGAERARLEAERALVGVVNDVTRATRFHLRKRYRVPAALHINLKEAFPVALSLRFDAVERQDSRQLKLVDSSVNSRGWAKGRSSTSALSSIMRRVSGELVLGGVYPGFLPVGTEFNPADDPTRGRRVRDPSGTPLLAAEIRGRLEAVSGRGAALRLLT